MSNIQKVSEPAILSVTKTTVESNIDRKIYSGKDISKCCFNNRTETLSRTLI